MSQYLGTWCRPRAADRNSGGLRYSSLFRSLLSRALITEYAQIYDALFKGSSVGEINNEALQTEPCHLHADV